MFGLKDRRGVSEVLSAILVILIAVSMGLGLFSYSTGVFGTAQGNFMLEAQTRKETVEERLVITAAYRNEADGSIHFAVYNYGKHEVTIDAVYVNSEKVENPQFLDGEALIKVYESRWIKADAPEASTYNIVVASRRGNTVEFELR